MEEELFSEDVVKFNHPLTFIAAGPSNSGKSQIFFNLIRYRNEMFNSEVPLKVLYNLPPGHRIEVPMDVRNDKDVKFGEGIPDFTLINSPTLLILDDLAGSFTDEVLECYTRFSHHKSISICVAVHNLFMTVKKNSSIFRTISLNTSVFLITRNLRDKRQIGVFASQLMPSHAKAIVDIYEKCTAKPYGYLCVNVSQTSNEKFKFRTNIFPCDFPYQNIVYIL